MLGLVGLVGLKVIGAVIESSELRASHECKCKASESPKTVATRAESVKAVKQDFLCSVQTNSQPCRHTSVKIGIDILNNL